MMKYLPTFLLSSLIASSALAFERQLQCKVVGISDGDTLTCLFERTQIKVRLLHIDAPEKAQPFGNRAKQALSNFVFKRNVSLDAQGNDRYGRLLAVVYNDKGENINLKLVQQGMAWAYKLTQPQYEQAQKQAQMAKIGLWQDNFPINPADWRHSNHSAPPQAVKKSENFTTSFNYPNQSINCNIKRSCNQINSYEQAQRYFYQCGWKDLDGNNDGIPCNKLYRKAQQN